MLAGLRGGNSHFGMKVGWRTHENRVNVRIGQKFLPVAGPLLRVQPGAHGIRLYEHEGKRLLELHLEVDESLRLRDAHDKVTGFERVLREALPQVEQVVSHIEPIGEASAVRHSATEDEQPVRRALESLCEESGVRFVPHEVLVQRVGAELAVSFHCGMDAETSIAEAHALTEQMEKKLRERLPQLGRVTIHCEPPEA